MPDEGLRNLERRWRETGAADDEARFLAQKVRAGELEGSVLRLAAYFGSQAAQLVRPDENYESAVLTQGVLDETLPIIFGGTDVPPKTLIFLHNLVQQDQEARTTIGYFGLVQEGDKAPPESATALKALIDDLRNNQHHLEAISQMQKPVFQLVPIYEPEGQGFQRMESALVAHQREGQDPTYIEPDLRARWDMNGASGKIVGWQVVVVEGAKHLDREMNPHAGEELEAQGEDELIGQLPSWQKYCRDRDLQLCDNRSYQLLQMQELRLSPEGTALNELGIDTYNLTVLGDLNRQPGLPVPYGCYSGHGVFFAELRPQDPSDNVRFRPAVVVKIPDKKQPVG